MEYRYYYTMEYLPTRYMADSEERRNRKAVWNFKDGVCSDEILDDLTDAVERIVGESTDFYDESDYVICFIPASTRVKTIHRYSSVAKCLSRNTGIRATLSAITRDVDSEAEHLSGKSNNPTRDFSFDSSQFDGKNVILVDDVITRGRTFVHTADKLIARGALSVTGLFVAKTVNPDCAQIA